MLYSGGGFLRRIKLILEILNSTILYPIKCALYNNHCASLKVRTIMKTNSDPADKTQLSIMRDVILKLRSAGGHDGP